MRIYRNQLEQFHVYVLHDAYWDLRCIKIFYAELRKQRFNINNKDLKFRLIFKILILYCEEKIKIIILKMPFSFLMFQREYM